MPLIFSINNKLRSKHSAYALTLKTETACSSETSLTFYQSIEHHILEDNTLHSHCHKNPKPHREYYVFGLTFKLVPADK